MPIDVNDNVQLFNSLRSTREYTRVDLLDGWGRHASVLACQLKRFVIEQQLVKRELTTNDNAETSF